MKTVVAISILALGSVNAFTPILSSSQPGSKVISQLDATAELEGMIGSSIESAGKIFDPVGLAQWAPADFLRKAELSNGRAAMLANVGWFWPKLVGTFASDDVTTTDPIEAILQADAQWWAQFLLFCGVVEFYKYRGEVEGKSYTGEGPAVIDWANQWDKVGDKEAMRMKELKNGRLAMLGFASYVSDYFIPGSVPLMPHF